MIFRIVTAMLFLAMLLGLLPTLYKESNQLLLTVQGNTCWYQGESFRSVNSQPDFQGEIWLIDYTDPEISRCANMDFLISPEWHTPGGLVINATNVTDVEWTRSLFGQDFPLQILSLAQSAILVSPLYWIGLGMMVLAARESSWDDDYEEDDEEELDD